MGWEMYNLLDIVENLISGNADRLDEKLIAASGVEGWLRFHRLEKDCGKGCQTKDWIITSRGWGPGIRTSNLDFMAGLNATRVGAHAVSGMM